MSEEALTCLRDRWEQEFFAGHRWGRIRDSARVTAEHAVLVKLWQSIPPDAAPSAPLMDQVIAIEFCNWRINESLQALCRGIGSNTPAPFAIGHIGSCTEERWRRIWAYYLAARAWLPHKVPNGFESVLEPCDPNQSLRAHVSALLGETTPLKSLYLERFCLSLEYWLRGWYDMTEGGVIGLRAAVSAIEQEIREHHQADDSLLGAMNWDNGGLFPCVYSLYRHINIILSSIGGGHWRAGMPEDGGARAERLATSERFLTPLAAWVDSKAPADPFAAALYDELGERTPTKRFLAALLVSLLRSQLTGDRWTTCA